MRRNGHLSGMSGKHLEEKWRLLEALEHRTLRSCTGYQGRWSSMGWSLVMVQRCLGCSWACQDLSSVACIVAEVVELGECRKHLDECPVQKPWRIVSMAGFLR